MKVDRSQHRISHRKKRRVVLSGAVRKICADKVALQLFVVEDTWGRILEG